MISLLVDIIRILYWILLRTMWSYRTVPSRGMESTSLQKTYDPNAILEDYIGMSWNLYWTTSMMIQKFPSQKLLEDKSRNKETKIYNNWMAVPCQVEVWQRVMGSIEWSKRLEPCGSGRICHSQGSQMQTRHFMVGNPYIAETWCHCVRSVPKGAQMFTQVRDWITKISVRGKADWSEKWKQIFGRWNPEGNGKSRRKWRILAWTLHSHLQGRKHHMGGLKKAAI